MMYGGKVVNIADCPHPDHPWRLVCNLYCVSTLTSTSSSISQGSSSRGWKRLGEVSDVM